MKYNCLLLLLIGLFYLQKNTIQDTIQDTSQDTIYKEGFSAPTRYIDSDLQDYLKMGNMNTLSLIKGENTRQTSNINPIKRKQMNTIEANFARYNMKECNDSGEYSGCSISTPSPPKIDFRYINPAPTQLNNSNIYNNLSLCPITYQQNMELLDNKTSIGQYSGYTPNDYIDKTRYVDISESGPLPVNPDFFAKNGGTY